MSNCSDNLEGAGEGEGEGEGEGISVGIDSEIRYGNKRKCPSNSSEETLTDDESRLPLTEFTRYQLLEQQIECAYHAAERSKYEVVGNKHVGGTQSADHWYDPTVSQLEELLRTNLLQILNCAVKRVVDCGYNEEDAGLAVLSAGLCLGSKDALSNVIDGALAFLEREKEVEIPNKPVFDGFKAVLPYFVWQMIHAIRRARPELTITEAMWCLLINDMCLSKACMVELVSVTADSGVKEPGNPSMVPDSQVSCPNSKNSTESASVQDMRTQLSLVRDHVRAAARAALMDDKSGVGRKMPSADSSEERLQPKTLHSEKGCKGSHSQEAFEAKLTAFGNKLLTKTMSSKNTMVRKLSDVKLVPILAGPDGSVMGGPFRAASEVKSEMPVASPLPETEPVRPKSEKHVSDDSEAIDYYASIPYDESLQKHIPQNEKDEGIMALVPHKQALEKEVQYWKDWANEKVMQATRKLVQDRGELKMLRQEKEEAEKMGKEKQALEDGAVKRLSEMEAALSKTADEIQLSNLCVQRLKCDNPLLKEQLEIYEDESFEAARNLREATLRFQENWKKTQSLDTEKGLLTSEMTDLKRELAMLTNQLEKINMQQEQVKVLFEQEEKEKLEVMALTESLRSIREEDDALVEEEMNNMKNAAEMNNNRCKDEIENLERTISDMKAKAERLKISVLRMGYGSYLNYSEEDISSTSKGLQVPRKRLPVFQNNFESGVKRERECVMCMVEEISVVLLPCAHQNLCEECSAILEKQGKNECPSCRTTIQQRIKVKYRNV